MERTVQVIDGKMVMSGGDVAPEATRAEKAVDAAVAHYEREKAKLYRKDGTPFYGPEEHKEREAALLGGVQAAVDAAKQVAEKLRGEADLDAASIHTDPTAQLTADELATANAKALFVKEDLQRLPVGTADAPGELEQRLATVLTSGDKATRWLYERYARQLGSDLKEALFRNNRNGLTDVVGGDQGRRSRILLSAADQLAETLVDPALRLRAERAEEKRNRASQLRMHAGRRLREADGSEARMREESRRRMHAMF